LPLDFQDAGVPAFARLRRGRSQQKRAQLIAVGAVLAAVLLGGITLWFTGTIPDLLGMNKTDEPPKGTSPATQPASTTSPSPTQVAVAPTQPANTTPVVASTPVKPLETTPVKPTTPVPPATQPAATKPVQAGPRIYTQRALLVGIKNYYYLNPLNPGFEAGLRSASPDPLGLINMRDRLTRYMNFESAQVAELSDVASQEPYPPLKASVQDTIAEFVNVSRPQDSIVLLFAGHAMMIDGKAYLAPIEAELPRVDEFIPLSWLYEQLGQCKARHKLLILDVAGLDPEQGVTRAGGGPLDPKVEEELKAPPEGVLVWVSCAANQQSYTWASSGMIGSCFLHFMVEFCDLKRGSVNATQFVKQPPFPEWDLPLLRMSRLINQEITGYVRDRGGVVQTPQLYGKLMSGPEPRPGDKAAAVLVKLAPLPDIRVEDKVVEEIFKELNLGNDRGRQIRTSSLPPFWLKDMEKYVPDYTTPEEFKLKLDESELRRVTIEVSQALNKYDTTFRMGFRYPGNEMAFKRDIEKTQELPAIIFQELSVYGEKLKKVEKLREKETPRWRAHYDYVYARYLAKLAFTLEYNYTIGSKLRKDNPLIENAQNNGWKLVPNEKLQQKETRDYQRQRDKILTRLLEENKKTPWELLAKREKSATLGLMVQEAKVD
jgi:hypothetical protein